MLTQQHIESRQKIAVYIEKLLEKDSGFTGKLEINYKDGVAMDVNETKRTKLN